MTKENISFSHRSVLLDECMEGLCIRPDGVYVDGTAGGAGHSSEIAKRLGEGGMLLALDQDETAVAVATERLSVFGERARVVRSNFCEVGSVCEMLGIKAIDGLLLDLGGGSAPVIIVVAVVDGDAEQVGRRTVTLVDGDLEARACDVDAVGACHQLVTVLLIRALDERGKLKGQGAKRLVHRLHLS